MSFLGSLKSFFRAPDKPGGKFVSGLIALFIASILLYLLLHLFTYQSSYSNCYSQNTSGISASSARIVSDGQTDGPAQQSGTETAVERCSDSASGKIDWRSFAQIDSIGGVRFFNLGDLDWYLGADASVDKIRDLRDRSAEINTLNTKVRGQFVQLRRLVVDHGRVEAINLLVINGKYQDAYIQLSELEIELSRDSINRSGFFAIKENLIQLQRLKMTQMHDLEDLSPPHANLFFWTSPNLSIVEVLFWALFGVMTNLLVNSAEYLRKNNFNPDERWVAYTKLVYGPVLAVVLVLAIMFGWLDIGPYEARVWTLPLVGFLFGYASRRTANLFDKLQEKAMGAAEKSIERGPKDILEKRRQVQAALRDAARPESINELRTMAKQFAREQLNTEVSIKGTQR